MKTNKYKCLVYFKKSEEYLELIVYARSIFKVRNCLKHYIPFDPCTYRICNVYKMR